VKFILFVEGSTEHRALPEFLKRWLDPKLSRPVGISPVSFDGNDKYISEVKKKAALHLNGPKRQGIIAVIGLLDLYGLKFPSHLSSAEGRYDWAKQDLEKRVGHPQFRQFFAVHELEAWPLSDPGIFLEQVKKAILAVTANPESVNFNQPPVRLLKKLYSEKLKRDYKKIVDGYDLFSKLDPEVAYQKCPRLKEMLDEMLRLAKDSGN